MSRIRRVNMAKNMRSYLGDASFNRAISSLDDNKWETYFESLTQPFAREERSIATQRAYDYTQAYSNYMATQRQVANTNIFRGQQEDILQQTQEEYSETTRQADADYSQRLAKSIANYQEVSGEATEAFGKDVSNYRALLDAYSKSQGIEFNPTSGDGYIRDPETGKYSLAEGDDSRAVKFFDMDPETREYAATDEFRRFIAEGLYGEQSLESSSFTNELRRTNPELYDFFLENQSSFNELVGLGRDQRAISREDTLEFARAGMSEEFINAIDESRYFDRMYTDSESKAEFLDASRGKDPSFRGNVGNSRAAWGNLIPGQTKVNFTLGNLDLRKNDNKISDEVSEFVKQKFRDGAFSKNDIFEYNGKLYVAESDKFISELEVLPKMKQTSGGSGGGGGRGW